MFEIQRGNERYRFPHARLSPWTISSGEYDRRGHGMGMRLIVSAATRGRAHWREQRHALSLITQGLAHGVRCSIAHSSIAEDGVSKRRNVCALRLRFHPHEGEPFFVILFTPPRGEEGSRTRRRLVTRLHTLLDHGCTIDHETVYEAYNGRRTVMKLVLFFSPRTHH